jgi:hypothetical protein
MFGAIVHASLDVWKWVKVFPETDWGASIAGRMSAQSVNNEAKRLSNAQRSKLRTSTVGARS